MKRCSKCQRRRRAWMKVWHSWWTSRSHDDLDGVALAVGLAAMSVANGLWDEMPCTCEASQGRHRDGHRDAEVTGAVTPSERHRDVIWLVTPTGSPKSVESIARLARFGAEETAHALDALVEVGTLERRADGAYGFPHLIEYQESESKRRTAEWRDRQKVSAFVGKRHRDGHGDAHVTVTVTHRGQRSEVRGLSDQIPLTPASGGPRTALRLVTDPEAIAQPPTRSRVDTPTAEACPPASPSSGPVDYMPPEHLLFRPPERGGPAPKAPVIAGSVQTSLPPSHDPLDGALLDALAPLHGQRGWTRAGTLRNRELWAEDLDRAAASPGLPAPESLALSALATLRAAYPRQHVRLREVVALVGWLARGDARDIGTAVAELADARRAKATGRPLVFPSELELRAAVTSHRDRRLRAKELEADRLAGEARLREAAAASGFEEQVRQARAAGVRLSSMLWPEGRGAAAREAVA